MSKDNGSAVEVTAARTPGGAHKWVVMIDGVEVKGILDVELGTRRAFLGDTQPILRLTIAPASLIFTAETVLINIEALEERGRPL